MTIQDKLNQIEKRDDYWDYFLISLMLITIASSIGVTLSVITTDNLIETIFVGLFGATFAYPLIFGLIKFINGVKNRFVKSYVIEDCGDVIKLHGPVNLNRMKQAYQDLLSIRPGYKILKDAYPVYGCTLAAVPASELEIEAKKTIEDLGFKIPTIGARVSDES